MPEKDLNRGGHCFNAKAVRGIFYAAVLGLAVTSPFLVTRTRSETFQLTYFPANTYQPTSALPAVDEQGRPKVVLVRRVGQIECHDVFYSQELKDLLERTPLHQAQVTYRVNYRFGRPFWIETLDVAGLGVGPITQGPSVSGSFRTGDVPPGNCF
jgi:hypothetical protein